MKKALLCLALCIGLPALAHEPVIPLLQCWREGGNVVCESSFSYGPAVPGARFEVTDGYDKTLLSGTTDLQGGLRFAPPAKVFHVLLWDARKVLAEAGWRDVKEGR